MFVWPASTRVFLCLAPCDMRRYAESRIMWSEKGKSCQQRSQALSGSA